MIVAPSLENEARSGELSGWLGWYYRLRRYAPLPLPWQGRSIRT